MTSKSSGFIWYELLTTDMEAAAKFYGEVIGWSVQGSGTPDMDYRMWRIDDSMIGGLMAIPAAAGEEGMRPAWLGYLNVADVDASIAAITTSGGAVHMPARDIPGVGRIAMVSDPQGAIFYVMAPIGEGQSTSFSPGKVGHGGWNELHTTDWQTAFRFYGDHFGWKQSNTMDMGPMGTYLLFNNGGDAIGGMFNNSNVPRPNWLFYFWVDDIDAAKARIEAAGSTILNGPHEVPGGIWVIQAFDPQGALFAIVGPRAAAGGAIQ